MSESKLHQIMAEIETKTETKVQNAILNQNTIQAIKTNPKIGNALVDIMKDGANEFKEKTGRNMTYSEMRQMYG